jgi:hypothetical protein
VFSLPKADRPNKGPPIPAKVADTSKSFSWYGSVIFSVHRASAI